MSKKNEKTGYGISPIVALPFLMTVGTILGVWLKGKKAKPEVGELKPPNKGETMTENKDFKKGGAFEVETDPVKINIENLTVPIPENNPNIIKKKNRLDGCYQGNNSGKPIDRLMYLWIEITMLLCKSNPTLASFMLKGNFKSSRSHISITLTENKNDPTINFGQGDELLREFETSDRFDDQLEELMPGDPSDDFLITLPVVIKTDKLIKYRFRLSFCAIYFAATEKKMYVRIFDLMGNKAGGGVSEIINNKIIKEWWLPYFHQKKYNRKKFTYGTSKLYENYLEKYDNVRLCGLFPLLVYWTYLEGSKAFWTNSATTILDNITTAIDCGDDALPIHCKSIKKIMDQINTHVPYFVDEETQTTTPAPLNLPKAEDKVNEEKGE